MFNLIRVNNINNVYRNNSYWITFSAYQYGSNLITLELPIYKDAISGAIEYSQSLYAEHYRFSRPLSLYNQDLLKKLYEKELKCFKK